MLSVIICSVNPELLGQVSENISETIGTEYELLVADNRQAKKGICRVYNELAAGARFPYLIFLHEDVLFRNKNWGQDILRIFEENPQAGLIGLAGASYKSRMLSGWYTGDAEYDAYHIIHQEEHKIIEMRSRPHGEASLSEAVVIDGVFIASTRANWQKIRFNEEKLKGFHFYDLDFSLRSHLDGQKVLVYLNLPLIHLTQGGDFGNPWVEEAFRFHAYMQSNLPAPKPENVRLELAIAKQWLDFLKKFSISLQWKWRWIWSQRLFLYPSLYYAMAKFLFYTPLGLRHLHELIKKMSKPGSEKTSAAKG